MIFQTEYDKKLASPEQAIKLIPPTGNLSMSMGVSEPPALLEALKNRLEQNTIEDLRLYYMYSQKQASDTILQYQYLDKIKPHPFYIGSTEQAIIDQSHQEGVRRIFPMLSSFNKIPKILTHHIKLDAFIVMVSPMDKAGYFSCGTNSDYTIPAARAAKTLIIEVNPLMPRTFGDSCLHISEVDAIVEQESPLDEIMIHSIEEADHIIADYVAKKVTNGSTLQIGAGSTASAICQALMDHQELGIHTDLMTPSLMQLIQSKAVTNRFKTINRFKSVYTLAFGDQALYEALDDNPAIEAHPADYILDPFVIAQNEKVVSINTFLQIDFNGRVNEAFPDGRQYTAPGSVNSFAEGAYKSRKGKSILAARSTAIEGTVSRIVPKIDSPAIEACANTEFVITEYGIADLRGKSRPERVAALIEIAHPNYRDALFHQAKSIGYL